MSGQGCPRCGATGDELCTTASGRDHRARYLAALGLTRPPIAERAVAGIRCDACGVPKGTQCVDVAGKRGTLKRPHPIRVVRIREVEQSGQASDPAAGVNLHHVDPSAQPSAIAASRGPVVEASGAEQLETFRDLVQRSDEWYAARCGLITASAIGRLITARHLSALEYACPSCEADPGELCRSKTRAGQANKTVHPERTTAALEGRSTSPLILEPAGGDDARSVVTIAAAERLTGFVDPTFQSLDMQRGNDDEPFAVAAYAEHYAPVTDCGFMVRRWGGYAIGYSPDGLVGADGAIEVKSRRGKTQVETILSGEVPAENMAQLQAGLFVSGRKWIDYVSFAGGLHLWHKRVTPDPLWQNAIRAAVERFEADVTAVVDAYLTAAKGLPLTDRPDLDMVV